MLTWVLVIMFPVGFLIMFTGFGRQFLWTTTIFLGLQALIMFLLLGKISSYAPAAVSAFFVFILSFLIEWWGVNTGFPFGIYTYTDILQPKIFGVPLAITFAWFSVTSGSLVIAKYFEFNSGTVMAAFISSVLILSTDILLEPFASFINNYWQWSFSKIPVRNFAAWLIIGFCFSLLLNKLIKWKSPVDANMVFIPSLIFAINILNFAVVNILFGYYIITAIGLMMISVMISSLLYFKRNENREIPVNPD